MITNYELQFKEDRMIIYFSPLSFLSSISYLNISKCQFIKEGNEIWILYFDMIKSRDMTLNESNNCGHSTKSRNGSHEKNPCPTSDIHIFLFHSWVHWWYIRNSKPTASRGSLWSFDKNRAIPRGKEKRKKNRLESAASQQHSWKKKSSCISAQV